MGMFTSSDMTAYKPKFAQPANPHNRAYPSVPPAVIVLPYPPSLNHMYFLQIVGKVRGKQFVKKGPTSECIKYMETVARIVGSSGQKIMAGPVVVHLWVYRPRKIGDLDNLFKSVCDGMKGVGWTDDSQVIEIHAYRRDDKTNPRVELLFERAKDDGGLF